MLCRSRSVKALFDCVGVQGFWGFRVCRALVLGSCCFGVPWQVWPCLSCCGTQIWRDSTAGHRTKEGLSITKQPISSLVLGNSCSFHSSLFGGLGRSATLFELPCLGFSFGRLDFLLDLTSHCNTKSNATSQCRRGGSYFFRAGIQSNADAQSQRVHVGGGACVVCLAKTGRLGVGAGTRSAVFYSGFMVA